MESGISQQTIARSYQHFSDISQEPLVGSYPDFQLKLSRPNQILRILQIKTTSFGRLKLKVEYLSYLWLDPTRIVKICIGDQNEL